VLKLCPLAHLKNPENFKHFHKKSGIPEKSRKLASLKVSRMVVDDVFDWLEIHENVTKFDYN